jgi:hypothetical protein
VLKDPEQALFSTQIFTHRRAASDEDISTNSTTAHWAFSVDDFSSEGASPPYLVTEETPERHCGPGGSAPLQAEHGQYTCNNDGSVHFNLGAGLLTGKKGIQEWCDNFDVRTLANTSYSYIWNGDCTIGACNIRILNWVFESHDITASDWPADVGLLIIEAFAPIPSCVRIVVASNFL